MREVIGTGKTVELATENALKEIGLSREQVTVEVVEMPVRKLFGSKPAKVRVCEVVSEEEEPVKPAAKVSPKAAAKKPAEKKPAEKKAEPAKKAEEKPMEKLEEVPAEETEKVKLAKAYITEVGTLMGAENISIDIVKVGETTILKIDGNNMGALIGRRGDTMEALSYLTSLAANRAGGDYEKIGLDVAGYRQKREQDLQALAKRIGAKVAKTGRSHMLEPMNPYERRIIHSTISEMEGVKSESTGEGADRRIVISSTDPNAQHSRPTQSHSGRGGRGGRGGYNRGNRGGRSRSNAAPKAEYHEHSHNSEAAPEAVSPRTETLNDAEFLGLYGKIEL